MSYSLLASLTAHGFFEGLKRNELLRLHEDILERGWPAIFEESHRVFWVDPKNLSQAGVGEFLRRIEPFLNKEGVRMGEVVDDYGRESYSVELAHHAYRIFDRSEFPDDAEEAIAETAFARTLYMVNDLLDRAGSTERLYAVDDPPGMRTIFLSGQLYEIVVDHPEATPEEIPYLPGEGPRQQESGS